MASTPQMRLETHGRITIVCRFEAITILSPPQEGMLGLMPVKATALAFTKRPLSTQQVLTNKPGDIYFPTKGMSETMITE